MAWSQTAIRGYVQRLAPCFGRVKQLVHLQCRRLRVVMHRLQQ